jgi:hypothetical protein
MIKNQSKLTDVTVLNTGTTSRTVTGIYEYNDAEEITIYAPAVLPEAGTIQVCEDPFIASPNWVTLQVAGADATPPAAGKAKSFGSELAGTAAFRIVLAATAADRTFRVTKQWST